MPVKIIPCLDFCEGRVVKGVNFVNFKDAGDPVENAQAYVKAGADELVFLDIKATVENRGTLLDTVKKVASKVSVPFAVGGGIRSVEDIEEVLNAGADKVSINSAAVNRPELIKEASEKFGKEKIIVAVDVTKSKDGNGWNVLINGGFEDTGKDALNWCKTCENLGAGELLITSLDHDGAKGGYDNELYHEVSKIVNIPITASGGAGNLDDFYKAATYGGCTGLLAASLFHFNEIKISELKEYLKSKGIDVK